MTDSTTPNTSADTVKDQTELGQLSGGFYTTNHTYTPEEINLEISKQTITDVLQAFVKQSIVYHDHLFHCFKSTALFNTRHLNLVGQGLISMDALRFMSMLNTRLSYKHSVKSTHDYFFNYSLREGEVLEEKFEPPPAEFLAHLGALSAKLNNGDGEAIKTGMVYKRNPKPEIKLTASCIWVTTPIGIKGEILFGELADYPEICQNVVWFVDKKMRELGINLQAYMAAVQEIGETLFKIHIARLANNPNRSAVYAQSFKENQSLRIEITPRSYFDSEDVPEFTTNVKFMGYGEDITKPSPAAMYAVITQKDDLLKPLNEELASYTPKE